MKTGKLIRSGNREQHMSMLRAYLQALEAGVSKQTEVRAFAKKHHGGGVSPRSLTRVRRVLAFWGIKDKEAIEVLHKVLATGYTLYELDRMAYARIAKKLKASFASVLESRDPAKTGSTSGLPSKETGSSFGLPSKETGSSFGLPSEKNEEDPNA